MHAELAELGNVRTQWNRMRIAKERAEAESAALKRLKDFDGKQAVELAVLRVACERLKKPVTDEEWGRYHGWLVFDACEEEDEEERLEYPCMNREELDKFILSRSQQAPASEEKP